MPDPVKDIEADVEKWEKEGRKVLAELTPKYAPRPVGTEKVSTADQKFDYQHRGPDYWPQMLDAMMKDAATSGRNLGDAVLELYKMDKKLREVD